MITTLKLDKIEKSGSGVKFAHIMVTVDTSEEKNGFAKAHWDLICTSVATRIKGNHHINSLKWFLEVVEKYGLEKQIREAANKYIDAQWLLANDFDFFIRADSKKR